MFKSCILLSKKEGLNPNKCGKPQKTWSTSVPCATTPDSVKMSLEKKTNSKLCFGFVFSALCVDSVSQNLNPLSCVLQAILTLHSLCPFFLPSRCDTIFSGTLCTLNNLRSFQSQKLSCSENNNIPRGCAAEVHFIDAPGSGHYVAFGWSTVNPCWRRQAARCEGAPLTEGEAEQGDKR